MWGSHLSWSSIMIPRYLQLETNSTSYVLTTRLCLDTGFGEKIIKQVFDKFKLNLLETNTNTIKTYKAPLYKTGQERYKSTVQTNQLFRAHTQLDSWFSISAKLSPNTNKLCQEESRDPLDIIITCVSEFESGYKSGLIINNISAQSQMWQSTHQRPVYQCHIIILMWRYNYRCPLKG